MRPGSRRFIDVFCFFGGEEVPEAGYRRGGEGPRLVGILATTECQAEASSVAERLLETWGLQIRDSTESDGERRRAKLGWNSCRKHQSKLIEQASEFRMYGVWCKGR
jgi:hypothetical protein